MKKALHVCVVAAAAVLMSAVSASAQVTTLTATLTGGEEMPIVLTGAVGTIVVSVDPVARELTVELRWFNLPTTTTAAHIHVAPRGIAGPVVIDFPIPRGVTGDFTQSFRVGAAAVPGAAGDRHQHDRRCDPGDRRRQRLREHPHHGQRWRRDAWPADDSTAHGHGVTGQVAPGSAGARRVTIRPCPGVVPPGSSSCRQPSPC